MGERKRGEGGTEGACPLLYNIRDTAELKTQYCERNKSENKFLPSGEREKASLWKEQS